MRIYIDASKLTDIKTAHEELKNKLHLPDYYGGNLDALADCVSDLTPLQIVCDFDAVKGTYADRIYKVFLAAKEEGLEIVAPLEHAANYDKIQTSIIDMIKEEQIKLGYSEETVRLYYPIETLNQFLGEELTEEEMMERMEEFSAISKETLGGITVSHTGKRFCISVPPKGGAYIHSILDENEFLYQFIQVIRKHECTLDEIIEVFRRYSDQVHIEKKEEEEFDYLIYFEDGKPDDYRYCFTFEPCHVIYHRFTKEDYDALGYES